MSETTKMAIRPVFILIIVAAAVPSAQALDQTVGLFQHDAGAFEGYTLFAPASSTTAYLIDINGYLVHSWDSTYKPAMTAYLLPGGQLLRTIFTDNPDFVRGGTGGGVERLNWDGTVDWSFEYSTAQYCQHHDLARILPSGNILLLAWELKTNLEAIAAGRNPALLGAVLWPEHIVEVDPSAGGGIVWEWHLWDHLVQNHDGTKANWYGVDGVAEHHELIDLNFEADVVADWIHANAIDYKPALDQILISSRMFSEFWVIDHSTTTAEAAGHVGGVRGKGGDILYRWGNPRAYDAGSRSDQKLFGQHDVHWIDGTLPGAGNILVLNNGAGRGPPAYSSVDEIVPPGGGSGDYGDPPAAGMPYGPPGRFWYYEANPPEDFYVVFMSGARRLANGNTLICDGPGGAFFEVTQAGDTVWKYVNPVTADGPMAQGDPITYLANGVFRCTRYAADDPRLAGLDLTPGPPIEIYPEPGDFDGDGDWDANDFVEFSSCFTGPGGGPIGAMCTPGDFDGDHDVDCDDWYAFEVAWTGPPTEPPSLDACHGVGLEWGPERQITDGASPFTTGVGHPMVVDSTGVVHVVWHSMGGVLKVYYANSSDEGATWTDPVQLSTSTEPASGGTIGVGPNDRLHVAWKQLVPAENDHVYYARSSSGGGSWESPQDISGEPSLDAEPPSISVDENNRVHVAWHIGSADAAWGYATADAARVYYSRSIDGGVTFEASRQLSTETGYHAAWPRFGVDGTSGQIVALSWRDNRPGAPDESLWDVYVAVSSNSGQLGTFTEYAAAATVDGREWDPELVVDTSGALHLSYTLSAGGSLGDIAYRRSTDLGENWSDEVIVSEGVELSFFSWWGYDPGADALWLLWKDERDQTYPPPETKADLMVRYSRTAGLTWSSPEFATDLGDLDAMFANITVAPDGAPYVVWMDVRNGEGIPTLFARRRSPLPLLGDMNCDGSVDAYDVPHFVQALVDPGGFAGCDMTLADMNRDGSVNGLDVQPFVEALVP